MHLKIKNKNKIKIGMRLDNLLYKTRIKTEVRVHLEYRLNKIVNHVKYQLWRCKTMTFKSLCQY